MLRHPLPPVAGAPAAYVEHAPPAMLRPFVACLWTYGGAAVRRLLGVPASPLADRSAPLSDVWHGEAHALGFHDQSRLTSELHALTGRTPGEWARAG